MSETFSVRFVRLLRQNMNVVFLILGIVVLSLLYPLVKDWQVFDPKKAMPPFFVWIFVIVMGGMTVATGVRTVFLTDSTTFRKLLVISFVVAAVGQLLGFAIGAIWLFCGISYVYAIAQKKFYLPVGILILLVAYYLFQMTGLIGAVETKDALHTLKQRLPLLALPLALCCWRPTRTEWGVFLSFSFRLVLVYLSCIILISLLLTQYFGQSVLSPFSFDKFYLKAHIPMPASSFCMLHWTHFAHPTYIFLGIFAIFMAVAVRQYFYREQTVSTVEMIYGLVALSCFAFITQSRLAMLFIPMSIMFFFLVRAFFLSQKKKLLFVSFILIIVGGFIFNGLLSHRFFADGERMQMRDIAMNAINRHPLTGIRLGTMDNILQAQIDTDILLKHPHNQLLADGMQLGIPGMVVLVVFVGGLFYFAYRDRRYDFLLFLPAILLIMAVESPLIFVRGAYLLAFWFSVFAVSPTRKKDFA